MDPSADGSSTSPTRRSRGSPPSARGSARSGSPGEGLSRRSLRALAARHGIRPRKSLGQSFLTDANLARRIVALAGIEPGDRVLEVGAGLGSLTIPLAESGASVLAVEFDRALVPALEEVVAPHPKVRVVAADAMRADWRRMLVRGRWKMVSNLPYNIAVPLVVGMLETRLRVDLYLVMVQREVGERLVAGPGDGAYGAVSVKVAYFASARLLRRVPRTVFWPMPKVESVLVRLEARKTAPMDADEGRLFRLVDEGFAQRRKTMRNALRRFGLSLREATAALETCGLEEDVRAEDLGLADFARLAREVPGG